MVEADGQPTTIQRHPLTVVARRTGLDGARILEWQRSGALGPSPRGADKDGTEARFSDADIDRLLMLRKLDQLGHRVADLADRSSGDLERLVALSEESGLTAGFLAFDSADAGPAKALHEMLGDAVRDLDAGRVTRLFQHTLMDGDRRSFLATVAGPFLRQVRSMRRDGLWRSVHECLTEASLRRVLDEERAPVVTDGPPVWLASPRGQKSELEGLLAREWLRAGGWRPAWLGADQSASRLTTALADEPGSLVLVMDDPASRPAPAGVIDRLTARSELADRLVLWGGAVTALRQTRLPAGSELEVLDSLLAQTGAACPAPVPGSANDASREPVGGMQLKSTGGPNA